MRAQSDSSRKGGADDERGQLVLDFPHLVSHGAEDFLVGQGNRLAYEHILAFPRWNEPMTLILGPAKSGKSHLARIFLEHAGALAAGPGDIGAFAARGGKQPLVIEDVDRTAYQEAELFHLLNQSMREHRPLLLSAREPVAAWPYATADLKSRARRALSLTLEPSDDIQLSQMLVKLLSDRQVAVDPKVLAYLVRRMERSGAEAVLLVDLMDRLALARGTPITRRIAAEALARRDSLRGTGPTELESDDDERDE